MPIEKSGFSFTTCAKMESGSGGNSSRNTFMRSSRLRSNNNLSTSSRQVILRHSCTRKGFTLIELLVVISIIAILSVIGLIVYSNFLKQSRDAKRQSDLKIIQSALEEYRADQFYYPASLSFGSALTAGSKTYLNKIPNDPTGNPEYSYVPLPSSCSGVACTSYCLSAMLETVDLTDECAPASGRNLGVTRP